MFGDQRIDQRSCGLAIPENAQADRRAIDHLVVWRFQQRLKTPDRLLGSKPFQFVQAGVTDVGIRILHRSLHEYFDRSRRLELSQYPDAQTPNFRRIRLVFDNLDQSGGRGRIVDGSDRRPGLLLLATRLEDPGTPVLQLAQPLFLGQISLIPRFFPRNVLGHAPSPSVADIALVLHPLIGLDPLILDSAEPQRDPRFAMIRVPLQDLV
jgi:hypothetical protein